MNDKLRLNVWFKIPQVNKKYKIPTLLLEDVPVSREMENWSFKQLEQYIMSNVSKEVALRLQQNEIKVIELINYSKGWVKPIARP